MFSWTTDHGLSTVVRLVVWLFQSKKNNRCHQVLRVYFSQFSSKEDIFPLFIELAKCFQKYIRSFRGKLNKALQTNIEVPLPPPPLKPQSCSRSEPHTRTRATISRQNSHQNLRIRTALEHHSKASNLIRSRVCSSPVSRRKRNWSG